MWYCFILKGSFSKATDEFHEDTLGSKHLTPERGRLSRLLIGTILILVFYVASVPWVFHLIHVHFGYSASCGLEYFVTIYCYPARRILKLSPTIRSDDIPYWQWAFRIVIRYLR